MRDEWGDMLATYAFVGSMTEEADAWNDNSPMWYGWALREAFRAGMKFEREKYLEVTCSKCNNE